MTPCSGPPPRHAAASWRLDLHAGCQDTCQRPWPASFTNRALDRPSTFLRLPVGRLPAGSQLGRVVLRHLFLQPPTKRRTLAKAPECYPSPPSADGREEPHTEPGRPTAAVHIAVGERRRSDVSSAAALQLSAARTDRRSIAAVHGSFLHDCKGKKAEVHGGWQQAAPQRSTRASLHCGVQPGSAACATCIQRTSYWLRSIGACQPAATRDLSRARLAQTGPRPVSMR